MSASRKIIKLTDLTPDEQLVLKTTSKLRKLKDDENLMLYLLEELQRLSLSLEKYEIALFPLAGWLGCPNDPASVLGQIENTKNPFQELQIAQDALNRLFQAFQVDNSESLVQAAQSVLNKDARLFKLVKSNVKFESDTSADDVIDIVANVLTSWGPKDDPTSVNSLSNECAHLRTVLKDIMNKKSEIEHKNRELLLENTRLDAELSEKELEIAKQVIEGHSPRSPKLDNEIDQFNVGHKSTVDLLQNYKKAPIPTFTGSQ